MPSARKTPASAINQRGFTIVELLMVLSALVILAAILFPLFKQAREYGYRAQCAGNMKQFAVAFYLYAQDWGGSWPCPGGLAGDKAYWSQSGNGGLQSYMNQRGLRTVWCCPLQPEWRSRYPARTYGMNSYLREPPDIEYYTCTGIIRGVITGKIAEPNRTILLYEGLPLTAGWEGTPLYEYIYRCANWKYVRGCVQNVVHVTDPGRPWHGRVNNYLYTDGHIVARPPSPIVHGDLSTYKEMREWYVSKTGYEQKFTASKWDRWVPRE